MTPAPDPLAAHLGAHGFVVPPGGIPDDAAAALRSLGSGRPPDATERTAMGSVAGLARVHDDAAAAQLTARHGVRALAVGPHVAFGPGSGRPGSGTRAIVAAHEAAHVAQQRRPAVGGDRERDADRAALAGRPEAASAGGGLALSGCVSTGPSLDDGTRGGRLAQRIADEEDPQAVLTALREATSSEREAAVVLLRHRAQVAGASFYEVARRRLSGLTQAEQDEALGYLGESRGTAAETQALSAGASALLEVLRAAWMPPMTMAPSPSGTRGVGAALTAMRRAASADLDAALAVMRHTPWSGADNELYAFQAWIRRSGTDEEYRSCLSLLHSGELTRALDESDPRLNLEVEREAASNRAGAESGLTEADMTGLFASRAMEAALMMLRSSEAELIRVLERSQGEGGAPATLDANVDTAMEVLNRYREPDFPAIESYSSFAQRVRAASTEPPAEADLRRNYDRQRQILVYRFGASFHRLVLEGLRTRQTAIDEHETYLNEVHWVQGYNPVADALVGPARAWRDEQRIRDEWNRRYGEVQRLTPERDEYRRVKNEIEAALPLLGGLDDAGLQRLVDLPGGPAEFDQTVRDTLARILGNVEEARRMLYAGEVSVWLLDPVVRNTRLALGIPDDATTETHRRWHSAIAAGRAAAVSERDRVRHVLEVINTGLLLASLGLALFTGGGSLALYVGLAGVGTSLGASAYDVYYASERVREAEVFHGSGLTVGTQLSDVPPDYRALHAAWVSLGVNAALSVFFLAAEGARLRAALGGEEAAARQAARDAARRLRQQGVVVAEDDLVEATLRTARNEGWAAGGTTGGVNTIDLNPKQALRSGFGNSLEQAVDDVAAEAGRLVPGTTVTRGAAPNTFTSWKPTTYRAVLPGTAANANVEVRITFRAVPEHQLPGMAAEGPMRLQVRPIPGGVLEATLWVDETLQARWAGALTELQLGRLQRVVGRVGGAPTAEALETALTDTRLTLRDGVNARLLDPGGGVTLWSGRGGALEEAVAPTIASVRSGGMRIDALRAPTGYTIEVPRAAGPPARIHVEFRAVPELELPPGPHGEASGPVRYRMTPRADPHEYDATVYVHENLRRDLVSVNVGHEIDEMSRMAADAGATGLTRADIAAQQAPGIFTPGPAVPGAVATAHDYAQMRQLGRMVDEYLAAPSVVRQQRVSSQLGAMGMTQADQAARVAALRAGPLSPRAVEWLDLDAWPQLHRASTELTALAANPARNASAAGGTVILDNTRVRHIMFPEAPSDFVARGIPGGHLDGELRAWLGTNPRYALLETTPAARAGSGFHRYQQWEWTDAVNPPPALGSPARPGGAAFNPAAPGNWRASSVPKTTVDDIQTLLVQGEDAFIRWRNANAALATTEREFGRGVNAARPGVPAPSSTGVEFGGFFDYVPPGPGTPATWRIRTLFVEGQWF